jgi:hypothetical protein
MESFTAAYVLEHGYVIDNEDGSKQPGHRKQCFLNPFTVTTGHDQLTKDSPIEELKQAKPGLMVFRDSLGHYASMLPKGAIQIYGYDY